MSYIMGKVRDATTYEPLATALFAAEVDGTMELLAVTDDFGDFTLSLDEGYQEVYLFKVGYVDRVLPLVFPKFGTTKISLFYMQVGTAGTHLDDEFPS